MKNIGLTFSELRLANKTRLPLFKNSKGKRVHSKKDGSDWMMSQWSSALAGEVGEACNKIKKVERGDFTMAAMREELAKELADAQIYLDLLAFRCGIDLGEATKQKFNEVSDRVGVNIKICEDGPTRNNKYL